MRAWNETCSDEVLDAAIERGKVRLADLQRVLTLTAQRMSVSEIARLMCCSRKKVIWMQHVNDMRTTMGRYPVLEARVS
jgi:hypothetical protein